MLLGVDCAQATLLSPRPALRKAAAATLFHLSERDPGMLLPAQVEGALVAALDRETNASIAGARFCVFWRRPHSRAICDPWLGRDAPAMVTCVPRAPSCWSRAPWFPCFYRFIQGCCVRQSGPCRSKAILFLSFLQLFGSGLLREALKTLVEAGARLAPAYWLACLSEVVFSSAGGGSGGAPGQGAGAAGEGHGTLRWFLAAGEGGFASVQAAAGAAGQGHNAVVWRLQVLVWRSGRGAGFVLLAAGAGAGEGAGAAAANGGGTGGGGGGDGDAFGDGDDDDEEGRGAGRSQSRTPPTAASALPSQHASAANLAAGSPNPNANPRAGGPVRAPAALRVRAQECFWRALFSAHAGEVHALSPSASPNASQALLATVALRLRTRLLAAGLLLRLVEISAEQRRNAMGAPHTLD